MATKPVQIIFPLAKRMSPSCAKLYSLAEVESMDDKDEDYILKLTVCAAEPEQERLLVDTCTTHINGAPEAVSAMVYALNVLDSVAFLQEEGDTDDVKAKLRNALAALRVKTVIPDDLNIF